jgi:N-carbamoylputrescine amidase
VARDSREIRLALIQTRCTTDVKANFELAVERVRQAAASGAQIVCLQELFQTRYIGQVEDAEAFRLAEPVCAEAPTVSKLSHLAGELGVVLIAGLFENVDDLVYYNTAAVLDADGSYLGKYRKIHIPDDPLYYEKFFFRPGDLGYPTFHTRFGTIGVLICWDQWFPEAARLMALGGAEILFYPTAIGITQDPGELELDTELRVSWQLVQRGHAVANACFVAAVNRVGLERDERNQAGIRFFGSSFVCHPTGRVLAEASDESEETLLVDVDLEEVSRARREWAYFFRDRRVDSYAELQRSYRENEPRNRK